MVSSTVSSKSEFYIFRDSRRLAPATQLVAGIRSKLLGLPSLVSLDDTLFLLLQAGELECGLCDVEDAWSTWEATSRLTDLFAQAAVAVKGSACDKRQLASAALPILDQIRYSGEVSISVPEGFAYYALHPLDYADLVDRLKLNAQSALMVGVRSIGTTLSAVVAAKLRQSGIATERFSARPTGHPYDRQCEFDATQRQTISTALAANAKFLICDEGPGRSGSSLLSVAEALEREDVPQSRIVILCSHNPEIDSLCAPDAARRWGRYRVIAAGMTRRLPAEATEYMGSGEWRRTLIPEGHPWPAVWPQMERLKYRSSEGQILLAFEGHGSYGAAVDNRNKALAGAGFGPSYLGQQAGFGRQRLEKGRSAGPAGMTPQLLSHVAKYCAWRASEFAVSEVDASELEIMTRVNFEREFGLVPDGLFLSIEHPTICDARMMPSEWLLSEDGRCLKLNAAIHGDDHFFPGPCDIAWDLAGIVVEWNLSTAARQFLLEEYQEASGDDATRRMPNYELAYATFRMAWSSMAAASVGAGEEADRLLCDYQRYNCWLEARQKPGILRNEVFSKVDTRILTPTQNAIQS